MGNPVTYVCVRLGQQTSRGGRALTISIKTLPRRLTAFHKFARRFPNQSDYKRKMLERIMTASRVKYGSKQVLAFKQVPNLLSCQEGNGPL